MRMRLRVHVAVGVLMAAILLPPSAATATTNHGICRDVTVPVALTGDVAPYNVAGLLCGAPSKAQPSIQVLLGGATEAGLTYWDFPGRSFYRSDPGRWNRYRDRYSYARYLAERGYASLTIDRIGTGDSSHPPAAEVTIQSNAEALHQVVQALRAGSMTRSAPKIVITVGRSLAGPIVAREAAEYGDVDGVIVQSFLFSNQQPKFAEFATTLEPAQLEPRLAARPVGYLTTRPSTRSAYFLTGTTDPVVVAHEEATRDTLTSGEIATFPPSFAPGVSVSGQVTVPVASLMGDHDVLFCSSPGCPEAAGEQASWPNARSFTSMVLPGFSHDMNLELSATDEVFPALLGWVRATFPG